MPASFGSRASEPGKTGAAHGAAAAALERFLTVDRCNARLARVPPRTARGCFVPRMLSSRRRD